jgi:hypothetical protein
MRQEMGYLLNWMVVKRIRLNSFLGFFPVRLLIDQVRINTALVVLWLILIALVFGGVGRIYGIHYLFLDPEYQQSVGFFSFWWVGLALGNFIMAFHITSYILLAHRYPFVAILEKPFFKFSINNFVLPLIVSVIYTIKIIWFHWTNQTIDRIEILTYFFGLLSGMLFMIILVYTYLKWTNNDIFKYLAGSLDRQLRRSVLSRERMMQRYKESRRKEYNVETYLDRGFKIKDCSRLHAFPDRQSILKVFDQNHFNSVIFELAVILVLLMLGLLVERQWAQIPASASVLLLFSMVTMLIGSVSYWFRGWGVPIMLLLFILFNLISRSGLFSGNHAAVGLNYDHPPAEYSIKRLNEISSNKYYQQDSIHLIKTLEQWKLQYPDTLKPKLLLLCVSGGGQRAALWTLSALQSIDKKMGFDLMDHVFSITGASGGMIGAAYYRELYLRQKLGENIELDDPVYIRNIGKDNLNALIFSLISNDIFIDIKKTTIGDEVYFADRGTLFEYNLNRNLDGIFDKRMNDYADWESRAIIPLMILSPTISNDGRRLYVSSSPISFMTRGSDDLFAHGLRGVDFQRLFANQESDSLTLLSAMRMSASFPYITPTINLPSVPIIEVMDAGIADNFGISDAVHISHVAKDWINAQTSGVVFLSIRDTWKVTPTESKSNPSLVHRFTYPISSVYNNLSNMQDVKNDQLLEYATSWLDVPVQTISFEYDSYSFATEQELLLLQQNELNTKEVARASLSWHLTALEKKNIIENFNATNNQEALKLLMGTFNNKNKLLDSK